MRRLRCTDSACLKRSAEELSPTCAAFLLGSPEPEPLPERLQPPSAPDLILVPGVGFDLRSLTRLGRGKGHYDRYLALVLEEKRPVTFVGVGFSVQFVTLVRESHDITMHRLLTEDGWTG